MTAPPRSDWMSRHATIVDTAVFLVAGGLFIPAAVEMLRNAPIQQAWKVAIFAAVAVLHLVPLTRRRWPIPVYGAASGAMAVLAISPHLPYQGAVAPAIMLPSVLLYYLALYEVCADARRWVSDAAAAVSLAGAALVVVRLTVDDVWAADTAASITSWPILGAVAVGGVAASWGLGRLRRTREEYQRGLEQQAAVDERRRIAREMHDVVSHSLAVMVSQAEGGRMATTDDRSREVFQAISGAGRSALEDMRGLLGVLRTGDAPSRTPAPTWEQIRELTEQTTAAGLPTSYAEEGDPGALSASTSLAAYRIVQEALTNTMKHAGPRATAVVTLAWGTQELALEVRATGERRSSPIEGGGTRSMRERARAAGGKISSAPTSTGWLVDAHLPLGGKR